MELSHLKYFFEVAQAGSFTAASRKLRVSQPSISKTVKALEDAIGARLLDRDRKGVRVTEVGRACLERCKIIFGEIEGISDLSRSYQRECVGTVLLGASDNICNYVLPRLIGAFCELNPKVNIKLFSGTSTEIKAALARNELELGLFYTPPSAAERRSLAVVKVGTADFVLVVSGRNKTVPEDFDGKYFRHGLRYVGSRRSDYQRMYPALHMHASLGLEPDAFIETNNQETQKRLVAAGFGYTVIPRHMIGDELRRGQLRVIRTPRSMTSPIFMVHRRQHVFGRASEAFRKHLVASLDVPKG